MFPYQQIKLIRLGCLTVCLWLFSQSSLAATPDWSLYQALLNDYAAPGSKDGLQANMIDYHRLKNDARLKQLVNQLAAYPLQNLKTKQEKLAFYLNAWNHKAGKLGGKWITLGYLEHKVLRKMGEPRVHIGLNCASMSCPDVRLEPYQADKVYEQLDEQARLFLQQKGKGAQLNGNTLEGSSIFGWFKKDFKVVGGYEAFIRKYRPGLPTNIEIEPKLKYNWSVNTVLTSRELRNINVASLF